MSANDFYSGGKPQGQGQGQGQYYPPPGPPQGQGGYYPQQPQQAYQQGGYYQGPPQQGYQPQPQPQTVYVQQAPAKGGGNAGCTACLAGICLCCCAEEICDCLF